MYCRLCDIEYPKSLRFCKWCGGGLVSRETSANQRCPSCGSEVEREWVFCNECGVDLATLGAQPKDVLCPACSATVRKGWMFCRQCGEQVATERAQQRCDNCGGGIRSTWHYCKQCGTTLKEHEPDARAGFKTVAGMSALPPEAFDEAPFSNLKSGELPPMEDVIRSEKKRGGGSVALPPEAPPASAEAGHTGGTHPLTTSRSTGHLDEDMLEREIRSHPPAERPPATPASPPTPAAFGRLEADELIEPPSPNVTQVYSAIVDAPAAFEQEGDLTPAIVSSIAPPPVPEVAAGAPEVSESIAGAPVNPDTSVPFFGDSTQAFASPFAPIPAPLQAPAAQPPPAPMPPPPPPPNPAPPVEAQPRVPTQPLPVQPTSTQPVFPTQPPQPAPPDTMWGSPSYGQTNQQPSFGQTNQQPSYGAPPVPPQPSFGTPAAPPSGGSGPIGYSGAPHAPQGTGPMGYAPGAPVQQHPSYGSAPTGSMEPAPPPVFPESTGDRGASSGSSLKWIAIAVVLLVVLGGGTAAAVIAWRMMRTPQTVENPQPAPAPAPQPPPTPPAESPATPRPPDGMVYVAAASFMLGTDDPTADVYSRPAHKVDVKAFFLDATEVTNAQYKAFVDATGHAPPKEGWVNGAPKPGTEQWPVIYVTWDDAVAYAKWAKKRLPTEAEWELAARGTDGRLYPWGNDFDPAKGNLGKDGKTGTPAPVGSFRAGASPCGALDMVGNVWEWTSSSFSNYPGGKGEPPDSGNYKILRGGAFDNTGKNTAVYRGFFESDSAWPKVGFRCAQDIP